MRFAVYSMTLVVLFLVAGALPAKGGGQETVFRTPVFIALLATICGALLAALVRVRPRWRNVGFFLSHAGIVAILVGGGIGFLKEQKTQFAAPISDAHQIHELPGPNETTIPLDFGIAVTSFDVQFYPPKYGLYRPPDADSSGVGDAGYSLLREVAAERDLIELGDERLLRSAELRDEDGTWLQQYVLANGDLMQMLDRTPKHYAATLRLFDEGQEPQDAPLTVNSPVSHRGWRFYLMSYDRREQRYVVLTARRDPGRHTVVAGIWLVIVGMAWLCWRPRRMSNEHA